jgi:transposase
VSAISKTTDRVVIAIDPHKASWTAAVVDASSQPVATIRVPVSRDGYRALRRFADRWPDPTWAIEGASGLGAPLTARLRTDGIDVVDVPAKLAARVRMLSTGHGRKNDDADAVSVGIAARSAPRLNSAAPSLLVANRVAPSPRQSHRSAGQRRTARRWRTTRRHGGLAAPHAYQST